MRAPRVRDWKDRLPGAALALAINAALFALLLGIAHSLTWRLRRA